MADARITAEMRMDNKQFQDAAKASTNEMRKIKAESRELTKEIAGTSDAARGLSQVMAGDLSGGIATVARSMDKLAPKLVALLGPLALVAGAFAAAYAAGKKLDQLTGISDAVARRFGGDTSATDEMAAQTAILRERRQGREASARLDEESAQLAEKRLKGVAKMEADFARESADLQKRVSQEKNADVRSSLQSRLDMITGFHQQDVMAAKQAEAEKLEATRRAEAAKLQATEDAATSRLASIESETEAMVIGTKKGVDRINAEFARQERGIQERMQEEGTTEDQRIALQEQLRVAGAVRDLRVAEEENRPAGNQMPAAMRQQNDSLARVGGFFGGERANLPVVERQQREQQKNNELLQQNGRYINDLNEQIRALTDAVSGGVDI